MQTIMEAFENHQEERKIAHAIKKQFDKEWSKLESPVTACYYSWVMECRCRQELRHSRRPPDPQLHVCHPQRRNQHSDLEVSMNTQAPTKFKIEVCGQATKINRKRVSLLNLHSIIYKNIQK